jgi:hypothetical protein
MSSFFSTLASLFGQVSESRPAAKRPQRVRLSLEALEGRWAPSSLGHVEVEAPHAEAEHHSAPKHETHKSHGHHTGEVGQIHL